MSHIPRLNIALVAEQRSAFLDLGYSEEQCAALTHDGEIEAVLTALDSLGHHVTLVPGIESLVQLLAAGTHKSWDLVFNMAQGFHGSAREAEVPALLEAYQIPFTFSAAATMALCQNKMLTKVCAGVPSFHLQFTKYIDARLSWTAMKFPMRLLQLSPRQKERRTSLVSIRHH